MVELQTFIPFWAWKSALKPKKKHMFWTGSACFYRSTPLTSRIPVILLFHLFRIETHFIYFPESSWRLLGLSVLLASTSHHFQVTSTSSFTSFVKGFHAHSGPSLCFLSHNTSDIKRVKHMENVQNLYAFCFFPTSHTQLAAMHQMPFESHPWDLEQHSVES